MTDKEKFRKEVEKLKSNLIHGACSSQIAMETRCKEEAYNEVLTILDTMQEEPVSEKKCIFTKDNYIDEDRKVLCEDCKEKCEYSKKEEPVSEDLGEYIDKLSKQFPEVSFAKLSRIAVRVAKWQKQKDDREIKMVRELLADFDKHCDEYHEAGFKHGQEALMKEAVNAKIHNNSIIVDSCDIGSFLDKCNNGEEIKIILIKEG